MTLFTAHNQQGLGPPPLVRPRGVACVIKNERMSSVEKVKKKKKKTKHSEAPLYVVYCCVCCACVLLTAIDMPRCVCCRLCTGCVQPLQRWV